MGVGGQLHVPVALPPGHFVYWILCRQYADQMLNLQAPHTRSEQAIEEGTMYTANMKFRGYIQQIQCISKGSFRFSQQRS